MSVVVVVVVGGCLLWRCLCVCFGGKEGRDKWCRVEGANITESYVRCVPRFLAAVGDDK